MSQCWHLLHTDRFVEIQVKMPPSHQHAQHKVWPSHSGTRGLGSRAAPTHITLRKPVPWREESGKRRSWSGLLLLEPCISSRKLSLILECHSSTAASRAMLRYTHEGHISKVNICSWWDLVYLCASGGWCPQNQSRHWSLLLSRNLPQTNLTVNPTTRAVGRHREKRFPPPAQIRLGRLCNSAFFLCGTSFETILMGWSTF